MLLVDPSHMVEQQHIVWRGSQDVESLEGRFKVQRILYFRVDLLDGQFADGPL
ncbi:hypothetical protein X989_5092 [Burkholderia pseudomallei MSHR4378]|nr:hypothetical protein X989_5092 [Burkholderia pseudomallei MSHR4378]